MVLCLCLKDHVKPKNRKTRKWFVQFFSFILRLVGLGKKQVIPQNAGSHEINLVVINLWINDRFIFLFIRLSVIVIMFDDVAISTIP